MYRQKKQKKQNQNKKLRSTYKSVLRGTYKIVRSEEYLYKTRIHFANSQ